MVKVTNNENMRRYVHMALSKMNSSSSEEKEITADDITPELLENEEILKRIRNWGLSDEEIDALPSMLVTVISPVYEEDLIQSASYGEDQIGTIFIDSTEYNVVNDGLTPLFNVLYSLDYICYNKASSDRMVLKIAKNQDRITISNIDNTIIIEIDKENDEMVILIGKDTL